MQDTIYIGRYSKTKGISRCSYENGRITVNSRLKELKEQIPYADQITLLPFSSETGEGLAEILEVIEEVTRETIEED